MKIHTEYITFLFHLISNKKLIMLFQVSLISVFLFKNNKVKKHTIIMTIKIIIIFSKRI